MAHVTSPDGDTILFKLLAGIMQGDTLAPYLFIIVLDYALRTALDGKEDLGFTLKPRRSRRHPAITITDLDYADDLATISDCVADVQKILTQIENAAAQVGLYINTKKPSRRLGIAGHCVRHPEEAAHHTIYSVGTYSW